MPNCAKFDIEKLHYMMNNKAWVFGLISNGSSLYVTRTISCFRNAFGVLCSSFLICNLQSISVIFTWCVIVLFGKFSAVSSPELFLPRLVGVLVNGPYYGSLFSHIFVALNRLCAVAYPIRYNRLWSESKALAAGIISYILGTGLCMVHLHKDCALLFNESFSYRFSYGDSYYGTICSKSDASASVLIMIMITCIDFVTLTKILAYRRAMRKNTLGSTSGAINEREVLFFKQSCLVGFLYITSVLTLMSHQFLFTNKWLLFASSTILWILMQSMDGVVLLLFNRKVIWKTSLWQTGSVMPTTNFVRNQATTRN
uniref:7TM_GPCR_Srx domain-containing protein n=1 Tax=Elaeophora elaphi TaxID=1147741 RepID=A0A0R3RFZ1_9BILA